jgi:hypothetical protein
MQCVIAGENPGNVFSCDAIKLARAPSRKNVIFFQKNFTMENRGSVNPRTTEEDNDLGDLIYYDDDVMMMMMMMMMMVVVVVVVVVEKKVRLRNLTNRLLLIIGT